MNRYDDIINLPHHVSERHPRMDVENRAAQFAPFSALSGYEEALEKSRQPKEVISRIEDEESIYLSRRVAYALMCGKEEPIVSITYRRTDGAETTITGIIQKWDETEGTLLLKNGSVVAAERITDISGDIFDSQTD